MGSIVEHMKGVWRQPQFQPCATHTTATTLRILHTHLLGKILQGIDDVVHILQVQLIAHLLVLLGHFVHAGLEGIIGHLPVSVLGSILTDILGDLHRAELGSAHGTEMTGLGGIGVEGLVVEGTGGDGIEGQVELIVPTEFESGLGEGVVPILRAREALGEVGSVSGDLVGDDAGLDVIAVGEAEMLLGGDVAQHGGTEGGNVGSANGRSDVIVPGSNVGSERSEGVERRLIAPLELIPHVLGDLVKGHVSRTLVHDLHVLLPRAAGQFSLGEELGELRLVVGVVDRSGTESVTDGKGNVVLGANVENVVPVLVGEILPVMEDVPLGMDGSAAGDDARLAGDGHGHVTEEDSGMDGEVIDALLGLLDESLAEGVPVEILGDAVYLLEGLVDGDGSHGNGRVADDPLAGLMNVLPGGKIHEGIGPPEGGPLELLHFLLDGRGDGGIANVGVDLHLEHPSNDLRLELEVILVGRNDGAAAGHLATDEFRLDVLARGDVLHLLGDHALLREVHLGVPFVLPLAGVDPLLTELGEASLWVDSLRSGGVVEIDGGDVGILEMDPTEGDRKLVSRGFMNDDLVLLGRRGEGVVVRDTGDGFEVGIVRVDGGLGAACGLDVGLGRDEILQGVDGVRAGGVRVEVGLGGDVCRHRGSAEGRLGSEPARGLGQEGGKGQGLEHHG
mmetsp:Transcript_33447/g.99629  ORF Transcript_33447/g.99629 Transcript_33447/m.99629 type:complete len:676 (+) Transcript_33447:411-2438(+)